MGRALLAIVLFTCAGCVTPYSRQIQPPSATLLPASHELESYTQNAGLSLQLDRTTAYCGTTTQAIANEIDQRQRNLTIRRAVFTSIGGAAGIGASAYGSIAANPDKRVIAGLGILAGGALITAIPSLGTDDRLTALTDKLSAIRSAEATVVQIWNTFEQQLLAVALLKQQPTPPADQLTADYQQLSSTEQTFRSALATLANACQ